MYICPSYLLLGFAKKHAHNLIGLVAGDDICLVAFVHSCVVLSTLHALIFQSLCVFVSIRLFVEPTLCTISTVQSYIVHHGPALCTADQCCVVWCTT